MKTPRVSFYGVVLIMGILFLAPPPRAIALDEDRMTADLLATASMLVSGPWVFTGKTFSRVRTFNQDGTFTTTPNTNEHGDWKIAGNIIILIFSDGHKDTMKLPLDPKNTAGLDKNGDPMTAVLQNPAPGNSDPGVARNPSEMLFAGSWKITGRDWSLVLNFAKDGTFTAAGHDDEYGWWKIANDTINLTFANGRGATLKFPLNEKGTGGLDKNGSPVTAILQNAPAIAGTPAATPAPVANSTLHAPAVPQAINTQAKTTTDFLLVSAPWKFTGSGWNAVRIFASDGTFTSVNRPKEYGSWKISNGTIILAFQDGHNDTLTLPLDPKGTDGADRYGKTMTAVMQDSGDGAPTPAPTAPPKAPRKNATPPKTEAPKGPVSQPFGTQNPG